MTRIQEKSPDYRVEPTARMVWQLVDTGMLELGMDHKFHITEAGTRFCKGKAPTPIEEVTKIACPMKSAEGACEGTLRLLGTESTCVGTLWGLDKNRKTESFRCEECGALVQRQYNWEISPKGEEND